jgi:hypothetical protein
MAIRWSSGKHIVVLVAAPLLRANYQVYCHARKFLRRYSSRDPYDQAFVMSFTEAQRDQIGAALSGR